MMMPRFSSQLLSWNAARRFPAVTRSLQKRWQGNGTNSGQQSTGGNKPPVFQEPIRVGSWNRFMRRSPITWRTLVVSALLTVGGIYYMNLEKRDMEEKLKKREIERQSATYGRPAVGGPFELIDSETGKTVTDKDFHGKFMILYFGFTHCPDVCPDELEKMSKAITKVDALPGIGEHVTPVFISVDPARDTPEAVKKYIKEFHPRFVGLTGTDEQVQQAAKAYRIYISRSIPAGDNDQDYLVDHSIFFFLMDPQGNFMDFFGRNATADEIAQHITKTVRTWLKDQQSGRLNK